MRRWMILALLPGVFFTAQLQAQTIRLDFNLSRGLQFDAGLEDRLGMQGVISPFWGGVSGNGGWSTAEGLTFGPVGLGYLHEVGPGRIYLGASYSQYSYTGDYATVGSSLFGSSVGTVSIDKYEYTLLDYEAGYEFKLDKVTLLPKIGRRSYEKSYEASGFAMGATGAFVTSNDTVNGNSSGLYGALAVEHELVDGLGLYFEGAKSLGAMTGSADIAQGSNITTIGLGSAGMMGLSRIGTADQEVEFTTMKLGFKVRAGDNVTVSIGFQKDNFSISYPGRFDVNILAQSSGSFTSASTSTSADNINDWMVRQALWGGSQEDARTGFYFGITKDIDL